MNARLTAALVLGLLFWGGPSWANESPHPSDQCLRCHAMETLAHRDRETGRLVDLSVDPKKMAASNHGQLECLDCHGSGFKQIPHGSQAKLESLHCLECHDANQNFDRQQFEAIERSFNRSVHAQRQPENFDCFSCHDPHAFQRAERIEKISNIVADHNRVCLSCHGAGTIDKPHVAQVNFTDLADLDVAHSWLPNREHHWRSVRCVECHTTHRSDASHMILTADRAEKNCVACHTKDSLLLTKLYQHRVSQERQKAGFINSIVMNESYIIGMTRHRFLDGAGIAALALTLLGVMGHGIGRWLAARRRKQ
ncbi:MAG: cytochrome c3 family protein [Magnetococcales bacterium]|nr:cytochrome c3 family protein [Magnetococcales bacterium]